MIRAISTWRGIVIFLAACITFVACGSPAPTPQSPLSITSLATTSTGATTIAAATTTTTTAVAPPAPPAPPVVTTTEPAPPAPAEPVAACDPSYPTVCIPSPPPDLDCKDIPYRRFKVLAPDPHNFDADHDGIGCESK
jgi:hypothetical protein